MKKKGRINVTVKFIIMEETLLSRAVINSLQFSESFFDEFVDVFLFSPSDPYHFTRNLFRNSLSVPCIFVVIQLMKRMSKMLRKIEKDDRVGKTKNDVDYTMKKLAEKIVAKLETYERKNEFTEQASLVNLSVLLHETARKNEAFFFGI